MRLMREQSGLTLVEVLIAIAILGIAVAMLSTTTLSSVQNNSISGSRTQATQVLNYLGRLVAGADPVLFQDADLSWAYGELGSHFTDLSQEASRADPALYRAWLDNLGWIGIGTAQMVHFRVNVCWMASGDEICVQGNTAGPEIIEDDPFPMPLPGIG